MRLVRVAGEKFQTVAPTKVMVIEPKLQFPPKLGANGVDAEDAGFDVAARPARQGRNPRTGETIAIAASKAVKNALNPSAPTKTRRAEALTA